MNPRGPSGRCLHLCPCLTLARWGVAVFLGIFPGLSQAQQWTTSGNDISNTNTGNVGVGITTPGAKLHIAGGELRLEVPAGVSRYFRAIEGTTSTLIGEFNSPTAAGAWGDTPSRAGLSYFYNATNGATLALATELGPIKFSTNGGVTSAMHIASSGNVGIGRTDPSQKLDVLGAVQSSGSEPALILNAPDDTTSASIWLRSGGNERWWIRKLAGTNNLQIANTNINGHLLLIPMGGNVGIGTDTPQAKLDVAGSLNVTGNIAAKYQDVAEWVPARRPLEPGTVVVLDPDQANHVIPASHPYDTAVAGVVSAQPGLLLGEAGDHKVKVATTGRVKVKAQATRGPIQVGDLLVTSDAEGVAMRSEPIDLQGRRFHQPGTVLGKALEPLAEGDGEILVLLTLQ